MSPAGTMTPAVRVVGPRRARAAAVELLKAIARPVGPSELEAGALLARTTPDVLLPLARYHRMTGLLYEALPRIARSEPEITRSLAAGYEEAVVGHLRVLWELGQVGSVLDGAGARWAVVKGPVLVESLYERAGQRPYADLDVIVDPSDFGRAVEALEAAGGRLLDRNWVTLRRDLRGQVHLLLAGGTSLDLHWNVINMYRGRMAVPTRTLLDRAIRRDLGGVVAPTLEPTDALLHVALHAGLSGGDRLIWLKDIERLIACEPPDWGALVERARSWRVAGPVGMMLARSSSVLGAAVPAAVRRALLPPITAAFVSLIDRLSPWELSVGRLSAANLVLARALGQGLPGGLAWMGQRLVRNLDPREPQRSEAQTARGTDVDRRAYFQAVAGQSQPER